MCSEGAVAVRRERLQLTRDPAVHLGPEVSGHGPAGNHPREEHGDPAPAADQQVRRLRRGGPAVARPERHVNIVGLSRILGNRVAELEKKFQTLELSGLWSLPGNYEDHNTSFSATWGARLLGVLIPSAFFFCPLASRSVEASLTMFQWE